MHALKFITIAILLCFSGALFLVFIYPRYYILGVSRTGTDIAEEIAEHKRSPEECNNILDFDPFPSPSAQEQSNLCIYMYAELTKDSSACKLLMPSEYGLSCINDVISQEYKGSMELGFFDWSECLKIHKEPLKQDWCGLLKAHRSRNPKDCNDIHNNVILKSCKLKFEAWEKYPELRSSFYFGGHES